MPTNLTQGRLKSLNVTIKSGTVATSQGGAHVRDYRFRRVQSISPEIRLGAPPVTGLSLLNLEKSRDLFLAT